MAITYFNSASTPTDNGTSTGNVTVTPPGSMVVGDLTVVFCYYRGTSTITVGTTGGQTWNTGLASATAANPNLSYAVFWCRFNGTWGANPVFNFSTSTTNTNAVMHVFRPTGSTYTWDVEATALVNDQAAPSTPFTCTVFFNSGGGGGNAPELASTSLFSDGNLVSYYKLEDQFDSKGSNDLGVGGSVSFVSGKFNNAATLSTPNTGNYLQFNGNLGIAGNGDITMCGWVNFLSSQTAMSTFGVLFCHTSTTTADRLFEVYTDNVPHTIIYAGGTQTVTNYQFTTGLWTHVAITRSGTNCLLYINGVNTANVTMGSVTRGTNKFTIGGDDTGASNPPCMFDDVAVFSRALTQAEIGFLASGGHSSVVQVGGLMTDDDNTWGTLTGSGFTLTGSAQYRNTSGQDSSSSYAHKILTSPEQLISFTKNQATLGGDPYVGIGIAFYEISPAVFIAQKPFIVGQSVKRSNYY